MFTQKRLFITAVFYIFTGISILNQGRGTHDRQGITSSFTTHFYLILPPANMCTVVSILNPLSLVIKLKVKVTDLNMLGSWFKPSSALLTLSALIVVQTNLARNPEPVVLHGLGHGLKVKMPVLEHAKITI
jgi:hypothetical protein